MTSSHMKTVLFLLTMLLQIILCSSGWVFRSVKPVAKSSDHGASDLAHGTTKDTPLPQDTQFDTNPETTNDPQHLTPDFYSLSESAHKSLMEEMAKIFGEKLAAKYFGPGGKKGFRWGYKLGKRIHSVARKCNHLMEELKADSSCPKPLQTNPLPDNEIVKCILEVTNLGNGTCLPPYESTQYPPEANCTLDFPDKIDPKYCNP